MDQDALRMKAARLREILNDLSSSPSEAVRASQAALGPLLQKP